MSWIKCSERMPEADQAVLVWNGYSVLEARWDSGEFLKKPVAKWKRMGRGWWGEPPTHWQPLPEPPK